MSARFSNLNSPFQTCLSARGKSADETAVRNPSPPMLIPSSGVCEPAISRAARSNVPSPPKTSNKSASRASASASGQTVPRKCASRAVAASVKISWPVARISRAALATACAQEAFPELPSRPTRLILSASFFNQHQEFFVARRAEQGGFHHAVPAQIAPPADERGQLSQ